MLKKIDIKIIFYPLIATLLILLWHFIMPSMLNSFHSNGGGLAQAVDLHHTFPAFARRPLTTQAIYAAMYITNCSATLGFVIINFVFLFLNGILLYFLSFYKNNNKEKSVFNALVFYTSFSVLFSFFAPIYSYDEPIQYFCLLCAMLFLAQSSSFLMSLFALIFLFFSLLARETSVLLFPALYFFSLDKNTQTDFEFFNIKSHLKTINVSKIMLFLTAFGAYLCFNHYYFGGLPVDANRDKEWHLNVSSTAHIIEAVCSCLLVLALPLTVLVKSSWRKQNKINKNIFIFIFITLIINALITFGFSFARESRIFALPLLLLYPIASEVFASLQAAFLNIENLKSFFKSKTGWITFICITLMIHFYHPTDSAGMTDYYHVYLGAVIFCVGYVCFLSKNILDNS